MEGSANATIIYNLHQRDSICGEEKESLSGTMLKKKEGNLKFLDHQEMIQGGIPHHSRMRWWQTDKMNFFLFPAHYLIFLKYRVFVFCHLVKLKTGWRGWGVNPTEGHTDSFLSRSKESCFPCVSTSRCVCTWRPPGPQSLQNTHQQAEHVSSVLLLCMPSDAC